VDRGAAGAGGHAGFVQDRHGPALLEGALELTQLGIHLAESAQLGEDQRVVALSEAVQVEDQAAQVAVAELPCFAEEAQAPAHPPARPESMGSGILAVIGCLAGLTLLTLLGGLGIRAIPGRVGGGGRRGSGSGRTDARGRRTAARARRDAG
jgi:hypothetical protein